MQNKHEGINLVKQKMILYGCSDLAEGYCKELIHRVRDGESFFIPTDDCFSTLRFVRNSLSEKVFKRYGINNIAIDRILKIPYPKVEKAAEEVAEILKLSKEWVLGFFGNHYYDLEIITKDGQVNAVREYLASKYKEEIYSCFFLDALQIGVEETQSRIESLEKVVGIYSKSVLYEMYCRNGKLGYLLYSGPFSDPVGAIDYLSNVFSNATDIAHILKTHFEFLHAFRIGFNPLNTGKAYISDLMDVYQKQIRIRDRIYDFMQSDCRITVEQWTNDFIPLWNLLVADQPEYPLCPSLVKALSVYVSNVDRGIITDMPEELRDLRTNLEVR